MVVATGVIVPADLFKPDELVAHVQRLEDVGYETAWITDIYGRHIYVTAAHLLANTTTIKVGTGIAHMYGRDAVDSAQAAQTLSELSGGRFLQGLGVSHPIAAEMRGLTWEPPVDKSRDYLAAMRGELPLTTQPPDPPVPLYLAAHGPKMLAVAAELADGAMAYMQTPEACEGAREILGPDKALNLVVPSCLTADPDIGRLAGRRAMSIYLPLPAYQRVWARAGFDQSDWSGKGSDRLIDRFFNWGTREVITDSMKAVLDAGVTNVIIGASPSVPGDPTSVWPLLEAVAPGRSEA